MFIKLKNIFKAAFYVAKITQIKNKKLKILLSVVLSNIVVFLDLLIIVSIGSILTNSVNYENKFVLTVLDIVLSNKYVLPFIVILRFIFVFLDGFNIDFLVIQVKENLKSTILSKLFNEGNYSTADILFYINGVTQHVATFFRTIAKLLNALTQSLTLIVYLLLTSPEAIITFFIGSLLLVYPSYKLLMLGKKYSHFFYTETQKLNKGVQKIVENMFLIKILKTSEVEFTKFKTLLKNLKSVQIKNQIYGSINSAIPSFLVLIILSVVISFTKYVKYLTIDFVGIVLKLFTTLSAFNNTLALTFNSYVHVEKLYSLDKNMKFDFQKNIIASEKENYIVKFTDVNFKYFNSNKLIFKNLNLQISINSHTIITGPNGSGKSTLLGLIAGLYFPESGKITTSFNKVGYVGVVPLIIPGTLKENLLYGNKNDIEDKELLNWIIQFELFENINIKTLNLAVDNKSLSSGQMQKISFIRALLSKPDLLILDESTSNLDTASKVLVSKILEKQNLTIINSTHNKEDFNYESELQLIINNEERSVVLKN